MTTSLRLDRFEAAAVPLDANSTIFTYVTSGCLRCGRLQGLTGAVQLCHCPISELPRQTTYDIKAVMTESAFTIWNQHSQRAQPVWFPSIRFERCCKENISSSYKFKPAEICDAAIWALAEIQANIQTRDTMLDCAAEKQARCRPRAHWRRRVYSLLVFGDPCGAAPDVARQIVLWACPLGPW